MQIDEKDLINDLKDETRRAMAFHILVKSYQERLYWHIRKIVINHDDTDDVLQNVFLKVWKNIENFRADSSLFTWLYRIATNEALSFINDRKRKSHHLLDEGSEFLLSTLEADDYFEGDQAQMILQKAILTLPDKQRLVFNMKYFDEMKYHEMAEILETSVGALKASYHHAVKKIEAYLDDN